MKQKFKFFFLLARRTPPAPSQIIIDVRQILVKRGHAVAAGITEEELTSLNELELEHDVYLLKSYTPLSLSLAGALNAREARLLNDYSGCMTIRNKIVCYQMLAEAEIPVPKAWVTEDLHLLRPLLQHRPLIVKPYMGWRGEGICLVRNEKELTQAALLCQTARSVASSMSKALAGILLAITASNYPLVFTVAFALSVLPLAVVTLFVKEPVIVKPPEVSPAATAEPARAARKSSVLPFVGLGFLIAGTAEMLSGLFPVIATEYAHLSKAQAGVVYAISTCVAIFSGPVFGWLADHVSRKLVLLVRSVANTLSSFLYIHAPSFAGVGVAKSIDDMGKAAFRPAWGSLMAQVSSADRRHRARTMSWLSMGEDAGGVLAPIFAGLLWNTWGIMALMGGRIVLAVITEVYAFSIERMSHAKSGTACERARIGRLASSP